MPVVRSESRGGVCTITLCDQEHRNALSRQLTAEMSAAFDAAEADDDVRVVVLTNEGSTFCAGANLSERASSGGGEPAGGATSPAQIFSRFARSPKPYVGRIAGHCVAGGMGLAAAMDLSVAADDVKFGFTEVRIGVAPAMISVVCLPKMRDADARSAFLRGNRFTGAEAARLGLVNLAVARERLDEEVDAIIEDLLAASPAALAASKRLLLQVPKMSTDDAFEWTASLSAQLFTTAEAREGMTAFLEKRPASWVAPAPARP
ncbi:enoyl-CoA hydratase/isomerase family protein [Acidiferrimicrobium sp. IK]|uniref:enoyl-CoA hydratase-related protein n=1 Tax=Acidiferrimicrobium sp. IK TaxID=2871700 RepID=UPI0021CAEC39|nr:enoyl-CoA hydratase-related protein [Acidiferrimicrobium sp. IK]MCU4187411.1 enoyl-CoA hydratase/isomerase family protein [Acidiferrimicrobium sp. IK]